MSSQPPTAAPSNVAASNNGNRPTAKPLVPPDEQFWERYSPHHEAPLSGIGSFTIHFVIAGFLILAGYLGWLGLGNHRNALPLDVVNLDVGGGGGDRHGDGDGPGDGALSNKEVADTIKPDQPQTPREQKPDRPELQKPSVATENLLPEVAKDDTMKRFISEGNQNLQSLSQVSKNMQAKLRDGLQPAGKGQGGSGSGGGKGNGKGPGEGDGKGDGSGRIISNRERRMLRWTMQFDTRSGQDYLRQLRGLGAILAIPKDRGGDDYWVIRDLGGRPPRLLDEDVRQLQRIFWIDDKPYSVASVMQALGLRQTPDRFVAFMPQELEEKLYKEELKYNGWPEDEILETIFQVRVTGGRYEPFVTRQTRKH
jgi:hypothetical protein